MLESLNENQRKAVTSTSQYVRIIAGAGSGKTRVLTTRIAFLVNTVGADPRKIAAITFTNKAAKEMKQRVEAMLGAQGLGVHISTIHSLCVRILREDIMCMKMPRNFTVLDQEDQKSVLKEAYKELGLEVKSLSYGSCLDYISNCKAAGISYENAVKLACNQKREKDKAEVYRYYTERLKSMYALDFDDLLLWTVRMFKLYPDVLQKWQYRFQYLLVDEFQDIDNIQYELITQLAGAHNQVYVVGDPDQTIYTWRGANVEIIMHFEKDFQPCETIVLNENYRSTPMILNGANSLIQNNRFRVEKDLYSKREDGEKITHYTAISEDAEALWIAQKIVELHRIGKHYSQIAILYRANYISRSIEKGLLDYQIPYVIYGGIRFYDRAEVKDMLSYLRLLTGADDLAVKRILNVPKRGLGNKTVDTLLELSRKGHTTMYEIMKQPGHFKGKTEQMLQQFVQLVETWKQKMQDMELDQVLEMVFEESGYRTMLEATKEDDRISNIKELMNDLHDFLVNYPESDLSEYLQMINLYTERDETDLRDADFVQLMTIHASKGLEFDYVFVAGLSEGVFPSERTLQEGTKGLEEERRLAYVAYTRAKNKLFLTEPQGFSFVLSKPRTASRFIHEIKDDYIEHLGHSFGVRETGPKAYTQTSVPKETMPKRKSSFKAGDLVNHSVFGDGVVIKMNGNMMDVAFDFPHGIKTIMVNHPSITKK